MNSLLKFDGPQLEELLARVQRELGPEVSIIEANRIRKGGVGGFFAKEWFEVIVDAPTSDERSAIPAASGGASEAEVDPFLAMASAVDDVRETANDPAPSVAATFELALAGVQREVSGAGSAALRERSPRSIAASPALAGTSIIPKSAPTAAPVPPPATRRLRDLDLAELLGHLDAMVPQRLLPSTVAPTIAVVGDPASVRHVAASLAVRMGLSESDVVIASPDPVDIAPWLAVRDADEAAARAVRWHEADRPTVVAVELSPGRDGHGWAASILRSIAADQVRLVAKAWQLTDQLATKALALGGVDGLDLVEMDAAAEPELFLELDLPIVGVDGRPATPELWAALLFERRTDERVQ